LSHAALDQSLGYRPPAPEAFVWPAKADSQNAVAKLTFQSGHVMGAGHQCEGAVQQFVSGRKHRDTAEAVIDYKRSKDWARRAFGVAIDERPPQAG
jgi:hypothetical protein